jgi:hypothetical protein
LLFRRRIFFFFFSFFPSYINPNFSAWNRFHAITRTFQLVYDEILRYQQSFIFIFSPFVSQQNAQLEREKIFEFPREF